MARIEYPTENALKGKAKEAWNKHIADKNLTNMKQALLQDEATYEAFMGWYKSWSRLLELVGKKAAMIYAHSISTTNGCLLCSLFFISDLKAAGVNPAELVLDEKEELLSELGRQIVKNPTNVPDSLFQRLKKHFSDSEIVTVVGFACQMIATNNFNSVLQIDVDQRLLSVQGDFKPPTWRANIE